MLKYFSKIAMAYQKEPFPVVSCVYNNGDNVSHLEAHGLLSSGSKFHRRMALSRSQHIRGKVEYLN